MNQADAMLRLPKVQELTGLSRSEIYRRIQSGAFPAQRRMSHRLAVWAASEINAYVEQTLHGRQN